MCVWAEFAAERKDEGPVGLTAGVALCVCVCVCVFLGVCVCSCVCVCVCVWQSLRRS